MKVFFQASYQGYVKFGKFYQIIYHEIVKLGYTHLDSESYSISYKELLRKMARGKEAYLDHHKIKMQAVEDADICVFETSIHSLGVGFLIMRALEVGKPTIALYYKTQVPIFLSGLQDEKFFIRRYDEKNLKSVLDEVLTDAKQHRDKRFNFFISPKLLQYLEKASKRQGLTKSKFIRNLILAHMKTSSKN